MVVIIILLVLAGCTYAGIGASYVLVQNHFHGTYPFQDLADPVFIVDYFINALILQYYIPYYAQLSTEFTLKLFGPAGGGFFMGAIFLFLIRAPLVDFRPFKQKESLHGDAKWASEGTIRKAGLRKKKGLILGRTGQKNYLIIDDFQHVLLFAPTGSGKGVGFVIPNLLFWEDSVICHDIKMENYELTSGYRANKLKQTTYVWNPADPEGYTHCYNPLNWISEKPGQMVDDAQKICNLILPEQEFWNNEARSLMLGVILYLCAVPEKVTSFGEVVRTMRSDDVVYNLAVVLDTIGKKIHPVSYMNIAAFLQKADKERSGCISTLNSGLELWANPLIDAATARSDFDLQQLKKEKTTIYVGVTPDNLQRLEPLLKVFYQQATDFLTRKMPQPDEPHGVMFMMDEFPSLGEMPQFEVGIAYFRGYRVKLFLIVQDTQQLKGIYEEAGMNSFLSNSYYRVTFSANNVETANLISQLVGNKTVKQASHNRPRFLDMNPASRTMHVSETQRALLLPQEVIQLPRDEQIILIESQPPIKCKKIFYFKDKFFTKRLLPQIELPQQEPYDPRKHQKKDKPKPKPKKPGLPPLKPPPAGGKKGSLPAAAGGGKGGGAKGGGGSGKPANPFDMPLPPPPKGGSGGAKPPAAQKKDAPPPNSGSGKPANPFEMPLPPAAAKPEGTGGNKETGGQKAAPPASTGNKPANPFDMPVPPAGSASGGKKQPPQEKKGTPPPAAQDKAGAESKQGTTAEDKKTADNKPASPFDLPPAPPKQSAPPPPPPKDKDKPEDKTAKDGTGSPFGTLPEAPPPPPPPPPDAPKEAKAENAEKAETAKQPETKPEEKPEATESSEGDSSAPVKTETRKEAAPAETPPPTPKAQTAPPPSAPSPAAPPNPFLKKKKKAVTEGNGSDSAASGNGSGSSETNGSKAEEGNNDSKPAASKAKKNGDGEAGDNRKPASHPSSPFSKGTPPPPPPPAGGSANPFAAPPPSTPKDEE